MNEFETLAECQAEQHKPATDQEKSRMESLSRLTAGSGVTKDDLIRFLEQGIMLSKCIATDDPRLKEK